MPGNDIGRDWRQISTYARACAADKGKGHQKASSGFKKQAVKKLFRLIFTALNIKNVEKYPKTA